MPRFGLLNIDKPAGMTSRGVVNRVHRAARPAKVGHAGTLDPLATGVLLIVVGQATRLIEYLHRLPKRYTAAFQLGCSSPTEDIEGQLTALVDPPRPTLIEIQQAAATFQGTIQQTPPAFSAVRVAGRRAYDLARRGRTVELLPRPITIHELHVVQYEYPELVLEVTCGTGTYIRSLGRDLARQLGTEAVMTRLARTAIGEFTLAQAHQLDGLTTETIDGCLLPAAEAVRILPWVRVEPAQIERLRHGLYIEAAQAAPIGPAAVAEPAELAAIDRDGQLIALLTPRGNGQLGARINFGGE